MLQGLAPAGFFIQNVLLPAVGHCRQGGRQNVCGQRDAQGFVCVETQQSDEQRGNDRGGGDAGQARRDTGAQAGGDAYEVQT